MTAVPPQAAAGTPGRRERRKARTRRALLDAALGLFARHGIYDARLEDITDAADLGKGAFYNYFGSKTELVSTLLGEAIDQLLASCEHLVAEDDAPAARVTAVVRAHDAFFKRHPAYFLLVHQARGLLMRHDAGQGPLEAVFQRYLAGLGRLLTPEGAAGMTAAARADLAAAVAGAVSGYRSFDAAAGMVNRPETIETFVNGGVSATLARRARRADARSRK
ncbi:MAG: TetR/AcrR family transcriptional regulator [Vicinamibacterales bacterium]